MGLWLEDTMASSWPQAHCSLPSALCVGLVQCPWECMEVPKNEKEWPGGLPSVSEALDSTPIPSTNLNK